MSKTSEFPSKTPPEIEIPFIVERNIRRAFKASYLKPKGKYPSSGRSHMERSVRRTINSITNAALKARTEEGRELEYLKESLPWDSLGHLAEIFAVSASRSVFGNEFAVSLSSFKEQFVHGVAFRFRQRNMRGRELFFDLYTGAEPEILLEKMEREFGRRNRLVLPLRLSPNPQLSESINKTLEDYPGIEPSRFKKLMAEQVWQAALTGRFDPEMLPPDWDEAVKRRTLAGYLIKKSESDKRFEPVHLFEKMVQ